ncbi:MAG: hypothetical protein M1813_003388 [Trichoglossum hirsutum]|nr:MAG: hypothetical protein M1813_003388 [Trichoglossum hirsutum]
MDGQDVMALDSVDPPRTNISRAVSSEPGCVPRRDSLDDAHPSRKRQRLDSGSSNYGTRSMSADRILSSGERRNEDGLSNTLTRLEENAASLPQNTNLTGSEISSPPKQNMEVESSPAKPPSSRVTINVRPSRPHSSNENVTPGSDQAPELDMIEHQQDLNEVTEVTEATDTDTTLPRAVDGSTSCSPISSPARSPEVEIAEETEAGYDTSRWDGVGVVNLVEDYPRHSLLLQFPESQDGEEPRDTVVHIGQILEKGDLSDSALLEELRDFFAKSVCHTGKMDPSQLYDLYNEDAEFWEEIPTMMENLIRRSIHFGHNFAVNPAMVNAETGRSWLEELFILYGQFTARLIEVDVDTMEKTTSDGNGEPDLISWRYHRVLIWILSPGVPVYNVLQRTYDYNVGDTIAAVAYHFICPLSNGLQHMARFVRLLLERVPHFPKHMAQIWAPMENAAKLVQMAMDKISSRGMDSDDISDAWQKVPRDAAMFAEGIDAGLQKIVDKHASVLQKNDSNKLIDMMARLLYDVTQSDQKIARRFFVDKVGDVAGAKPDDIPHLVLYGWKFTLLKKFITGGKMDLRVQGILKMVDDLLSAWQQFGLKGDLNHPVMNYLSMFILNNKLVDYIVGVESHPELIGRSGNIVSFLVVTHKYPPEVSDAIWNTVVTSQNPRVVAAVLQMLKDIHNNMNYDSLIYLCQKVGELPFSAFDGKMIEYCAHLLHQIRVKFSPVNALTKLDISPYHLSIRLIRQAAAFQEQSPSCGNNPVYEFASRELHELVNIGPTNENRRKIYHECVQDIANMTPSATGSICAINAFLRRKATGSGISDTRMLTEELSLTSLVVSEFAHGIEVEREKKSHAQINNAVVRARLDLLYYIITYAAPTITADLGERLWSYLVGEQALGDAERHAAWTVLCKIASDLRTRNVFIDRCIEDYLPCLDPRFFISGMLSFTQQAIQYEARLNHQAPTLENEIVDIFGAEQVWRMILTSPSGTIEHAAIQFFVKLYLDTLSIANAPRSAAEATHVMLVDRCIRKLGSAASKLKAFSDGSSSGDDEPMVIVASDADVLAEELCFNRSLCTLKEFLSAYRTRPQYAPQKPKMLYPPPPVKEINGELLSVRWQSFTANMHSNIQELMIGDLDTSEELGERLVASTGFSRFVTYSGGRILNLEENPSMTLRDMKLGENPFIIVKKIHDPSEVQEAGLTEDLSVVELEVLKHFDGLYDLLSMERSSAKEIWHFLNRFPPQEKIRKVVLSETSTSADIFPTGQPWKILYSSYTLRTCLDDQLQKVRIETALSRRIGTADFSQGIANEKFISRSVNVLVEALTSNDLLEGTDVYMKILLAKPVSSETSATYFPDEAALVERLVTLLKAAKSLESWSYQESPVLAWQCFSAIIEASIHSAAFWNIFTWRPDIPGLIKEIVLDDPRLSLRKCVAERMSHVCKVLPNSSKVNEEEFASFFWQILSKILPEAKCNPENSEQLFQAALAVFRSVGEFSRDSLDIEGYIIEWGTLLVAHKHEEFVGRENWDFIVSGFTRLLVYCLQLAKSQKKPFNAGNLAKDVFRAHLFPDLSLRDSSSTTVVTERVPVLQSPTRQEICRLLLLLSQDTESYREILDLVSEVVPEGGTAHLPSSTAPDPLLLGFAYELAWSFDRSKYIRSPTGYVGLRNLSNTCYLNSLFTQLFMNLPFRGFMLDATIADAEGSQKLLSETKRLFAFMQNSWTKWIEPRDVAGAIRTYENEHIDVTVQMDVDEFYNLLFDRWEGQILSLEAKKKFRSFYGGQLVQQVKSKECPHISEREEPFSAIQCDIKGKTTLEESLKAYVEGEIMEGDNKYSCTSCNRHVDAVKRTCLKDVPDNLIFHLKRFDFDLRTMQRSKINDFFEFPSIIDMKPYKVQHLSDPTIPTPEDVFELVGVLVHSGTAESGHYYSFIRERPASQFFPTPTWVEFNDSDVTPFDPNTIAAQCFGGGGDIYTQSKDALSMNFPKTYSAYMLFYQRSSSLQAQQQMQEPLTFECPKKLAVPLDLGNYIAYQNEIFIRRHCLYDPYHAPFVRQLLDTLRYLNKGLCSEDHQIEKSAIWLALDHMDQVVARTKDLPDFDSMMGSIMKVICSCSECCKLALDWLSARPEAMRNMLLKNPLVKVRQEFARMIMTALRTLRQMDAQLYGFEINPDEPADWTEGFGAFHSILNLLYGFWCFIHLHMKAWDDYFGLLADMALLGVAESTAILRLGYLRKCLELLCIENLDRGWKGDYAGILKQIERGRKASHCKVVELLRVLLSRIDLKDHEHPEDEEDRHSYPPSELYPLTKRELHYFYLYIRKTNCLIFVSKILDLNQNPGAAKAILTQMVVAEPELNMLMYLFKTITSGIAIEPASLAGPYLHAAVIFCQFAPNPTEIKELISRTAQDMDTIGDNGGRDHLQFFRTLAETENRRIHQNLVWIRYRVIEMSPFWAPPLLTFCEGPVREDTEVFLHQLIFDYSVPPNVPERYASRLVDTAKALAERCMNYLDVKWVACQKPIDAKLMQSILRVLLLCRPYFEDEEEDFNIRLESLKSNLEKLMLEEGDEVASGTFDSQLYTPEEQGLIDEEEWDNDSNMASDSDVDQMQLRLENPSP